MAACPPDRPIALVTNVAEYAGFPAAQALTRAGFAVVCHDRTFACADPKATFRERQPDLVGIPEQDPEAIVEVVIREYGRLDVLVSNDSYPARRVGIEDASLDDYRATIEALMIAPFALVRAAARQMKERRSGRIILISSASPLRPYPGFSMYASARGGANTLAVALAKELAEFGISVNAVAPNFLSSETYYPKEKWVNDPKYARRVEEMVPLKRLGRPEEIGEVIAFLASGKADFVTGQVIPFTGGWP